MGGSANRGFLVPFLALSCVRTPAASEVPATREILANPHFGAEFKIVSEIPLIESLDARVDLELSVTAPKPSLTVYRHETTPGSLIFWTSFDDAKDRELVIDDPSTWKVPLGFAEAFHGGADAALWKSGDWYVYASWAPSDLKLSSPVEPGVSFAFAYAKNTPVNLKLLYALLVFADRVPTTPGLASDESILQMLAEADTDVLRFSGDPRSKATSAGIYGGALLHYGVAVSEPHLVRAAVAYLVVATEPTEVPAVLRGAYMHTLGVACHRLFGFDPKTEYLDCAIQALETALPLREASGSGFRESLWLLSEALARRYELDGKTVDLCAAVRHQQRAVDLRAPTSAEEQRLVDGRRTLARGKCGE